jgi:hypothetical protein
VRDAWWAYRNLGNPEASPPSELARRLLVLGREEPDKFLAAPTALEARPSRGEGVNEGAGELRRNGTPARLDEALDDGQGRRLKRLMVPAENIGLCVRGQSTLRVRGLPHDARLVDVRPSASGEAFAFIFRSWSFAPLPEGAPVPEFRPEED